MVEHPAPYFFRVGADSLIKIKIRNTTFGILDVSLKSCFGHFGFWMSIVNHPFFAIRLY